MMANLARRVAVYALLPGVVPRFRGLLSGGSGVVTMGLQAALVGLGLLPRGYVALQGRAGLLALLGAAAVRLEWSRAGMGQIILFLLLLAGIVLVGVQLLLLALSIFAGSAQAAVAVPVGTARFLEWFGTANPTQDIAFILLDRVFGIPGMFGSCVAQNVPCLGARFSDGAFPSGGVAALHNTIRFYNTGLFVIAALLVSYHVVTVLAEMNETGIPFGKRFNRTWAALRVIFALGLLVPMNHGLNAAQYFGLYAGKWGSGFATNGWVVFVNGMDLSTDNTMAGDKTRLVALPKPPGANEIIQFMSTAKTCQIAYRVMYGKKIEAFAVRSPKGGRSTVEPLLDFDARGFGAKQQWFDYSDMKFVFGELDAVKHEQFPGGVRPFCGEVTLPATRVSAPGAGYDFADGADWIQQKYIYQLIVVPWDWDETVDGVMCDVCTALGVSPDFSRMAEAFNHRTLERYKDLSFPAPTELEKAAAFDWYSWEVAIALQDAYDLHINGDMGMNSGFGTVQGLDWYEDATRHGWAGAAIWYNKIADANGYFTAAVFNLPVASKLPEIMEWVGEERTKANSYIPGENFYEPTLPDGREIQFANARDKELLKPMNAAYVMWNDYFEYSKPPLTGNIIADSITAIFKKAGLWSLRDNETIHPLASMVTMGKSLLDTTIMAFGGAGVAGLASMAGGKTVVGVMAQSLGSVALSVILVTMVAGVVLFYVVPFLPFIYFLFAVAGWIKALFEAMFGLPLWAIAHLRMDGEGFPTAQAMSGYLLLVEIFLRPILTVFGLIASVMVFYAMARTLNNVFDLVTSNLTGFDLSAADKAKLGESGSLVFFKAEIDQLVFTLIYAVICYMLALSCFKLIDLLPNNILRWMNSAVKGFGQMAQEDVGADVSNMVRSETYKLSDAGQGLTGALLQRQ